MLITPRWTLFTNFVAFFLGELYFKVQLKKGLWKEPVCDCNVAKYVKVQQVWVFQQWHNERMLFACIYTMWHFLYLDLKTFKYLLEFNSEILSPCFCPLCSWLHCKQRCIIWSISATWDFMEGVCSNPHWWWVKPSWCFVRAFKYHMLLGFYFYVVSFRFTARRETHRGDSAGGAQIRYQPCDKHKNKSGGASGWLQSCQPHWDVFWRWEKG